MQGYSLQSSVPLELKALDLYFAFWNTLDLKLKITFEVNFEELYNTFLENVNWLGLCMLFSETSYLFSDELLKVHMQKIYLKKFLSLDTLVM